MVLLLYSERTMRRQTNRNIGGEAAATCAAPRVDNLCHVRLFKDLLIPGFKCLRLGMSGLASVKNGSQDPGVRTGRRNRSFSAQDFL